MKLFTLMAATLLAGAGLLSAQFEAEPKYDASAVSALVDRVHQDLDHAYSVFHFSSGDRDRLNRAEKDLREFSQKWEHGKFDKGQLNGAIDSIQKVLDNNKLPAEQREAISGDVTQLRRMREAYERHEVK
jgi:ribosomal 50S subunit-associated protein YjgA (DUF615 family)